MRSPSQALVASDDSRDGSSVFAQRVRQLRYAKGWGPDDLAARAKISRTALYQIESGKTGQPRAGTVRRLARAFGVTPESLLDESVTMSNSLRTRLSTQAAQGVGSMEGSLEAVVPTELAAGEAPPWLRDLDLERKFRRLLDSPMREAVARIVEESYRLLPPEPFEGTR